MDMSIPNYSLYIYQLTIAHISSIEYCFQVNHLISLNWQKRDENDEYQ